MNDLVLAQLLFYGVILLFRLAMYTEMLQLHASVWPTEQLGQYPTKSYTLPEGNNH